MVDFHALADQGWPHDEYRKHGAKARPFKSASASWRDACGLQPLIRRARRHPAARGREDRRAVHADRKSGVKGKSVSARVDLGVISVFTNKTNVHRRQKIYEQQQKKR